MVPAAEGLINKMLLALPSGMELQHEPANLGWLKGTLQNWVSDLQPQASIFLLFAPGVGEEAERLMEDFLQNIRELVPGRYIHPVPAALSPQRRIGYEIWIRDPFVVVQRGGVTHLLEPRAFGRQEDRHLADCLQMHCGIPLAQSGLDFEGGNILGLNGQFAIVGPDSIEANRKRIYPHLAVKEGRRQVEQDFASELGVQHVITPYLPKPHNLPDNYHGGAEGLQPLYHLDIFLTPCGLDHQGNEVLLVAELREHRQSRLMPYNEHLRTLEAALNWTAGFFRDYHTTHPGIRFSVHRIPFLVVQEGGLHYRTWNNCLIENNGFQRRAYLPSYHHDDRHHQDPKSVEFSVQGVFGRLGFEVKWMQGSYDSLAQGLGSLHCMSQILERS